MRSYTSQTKWRIRGRGRAGRTCDLGGEPGAGGAVGVSDRAPVAAYAGCAPLPRRSLLFLFAAATPLGGAFALQSGGGHRLGVFVQAPRTSAHWVAFFDELRASGLSEGRNLEIIDGFDTPLDRAEAVAKAIVEAKPDAISTAGALTALLQRLTPTIPIVTVSDDLLAEGVVTSLAHPTGNTTGISILATELDRKRQEILLEAVPDARHLAILADPAVSKPEQLRQLERAARAQGRAVSTHLAGSADKILPSIEAAVAAGAQALNVLASSLFSRYRAQIFAECAAASLPAIYQWPEMAEDGGLLAYGPRFVTIFRQHARQVLKVLMGTKPADIPVEQPTTLEFVVNMPAAAKLRLQVPKSLLVRADKIIE